MHLLPIVDPLPDGIIDEILMHLNPETGFHLVETLCRLTEILPTKLPRSIHCHQHHNTKTLPKMYNHRFGSISLDGESKYDTFGCDHDAGCTPIKPFLLRRANEGCAPSEPFQPHQTPNCTPNQPFQSHQTISPTPTMTTTAHDLRRFIFSNITNGSYWFHSSSVGYKPPRLDICRRNVLFFSLIINHHLPNLTSLSLSLCGLHEITCGIECESEWGRGLGGGGDWGTEGDDEKSGRCDAINKSDNQHPQIESHHHQSYKRHPAINRRYCPFRDHWGQPSDFSRALESLLNLQSLTLTFGDSIRPDDVFSLMYGDERNFGATNTTLHTSATATTTHTTQLTHHQRNNHKLKRTTVSSPRPFTLPHLQHLVLSNNNLTPADISHLSRTTSFPSLLSLDVSKNQLNQDLIAPIHLKHSVHSSNTVNAHLMSPRTSTNINSVDLLTTPNTHSATQSHVPHKFSHHLQPFSHHNPAHGLHTTLPAFPTLTTTTGFHLLFDWASESFPHLTTLVFWPQYRPHYDSNSPYPVPTQCFIRQQWGQVHPHAYRIIPLIEALANSPVLVRLTVLDCGGMFRYNDIIAASVEKREELIRKEVRGGMIENKDMNVCNNNNHNKQIEKNNDNHPAFKGCGYDPLAALLQSPYLSPALNDLANTNSDNDPKPQAKQNFPSGPKRRIEDETFAGTRSQSRPPQSTPPQSTPPQSTPLHSKPQLRTLILDHTGHLSPLVVSLLSTPRSGLDQVTSLSLSNCNLSDDVLVALCKSRCFPNLKRLNLSWNTHLSDEAIRVLCASPLSTKLIHLDISHCKLGLESLRHIGESCHLTKLTHFNTASNNFSPITMPIPTRVNDINCGRDVTGLNYDHFGVFIQSQNLQNLVSLDLSCTNLSSSALKSIPGSQYLFNLQSLSLMGNDVNRGGDIGVNVVRVAHSQQEQLPKPLNDQSKPIPSFQNWTHQHQSLSFSQLLFHSPFLCTNLNAINLTNCNINDTDILHLVESPYLSNLTQLGLSGNENVSSAGVELFDQVWRNLHANQGFD